MRTNVNKTESMIISDRDQSHYTSIEGHSIELISDFKYLGSTIGGNSRHDKKITDKVDKVGKILK